MLVTTMGAGEDREAGEATWEHQEVPIAEIRLQTLNHTTKRTKTEQGRRQRKVKVCNSSMSVRRIHSIENNILLTLITMMTEK